MQFDNGNIDIPESLKEKSFDVFKDYYKRVIKGRLNLPPEEVYTKLGGKLPEKKAKKAKQKPTTDNKGAE